MGRSRTGKRVSNAEKPKDTPRPDDTQTEGVSSDKSYSKVTVNGIEEWQTVTSKSKRKKQLRKALAEKSGKILVAQSGPASRTLLVLKEPVQRCFVATGKSMYQ